MALMHGCLAVRVKGTTCHVRQLLGLEGRTSRSDTGFADAALGRCRHQACSRQRRVAALRRTHADRGVAFHQLDIAVADARGVDDVTYLQIFVEIDEILALGVREDRPAEIDLGFTAQGGRFVSGLQTQCRNRVVRCVG